MGMNVRIAAVFLVCRFSFVSLKHLNLLTCQPPHYPQYGSYGPKNDVYNPGDIIHYYCDVDTYIGGSYWRICQDNGDWSGDTPVCDSATAFSIMEQSSTEEPMYRNSAESASDGDRSTCSSTLGEFSSTWTGTFDTKQLVIRIMLFLPRGDIVAYEVISVREDGTEFSCGQNQRYYDKHEWAYHHCPEPNNTNIRAIKVESLDDSPLEICEILVHSVTEPACFDPRVYIDNGRLMLSRKSAILVCDKGFRTSQDKKLTCIRNGVWTRKNLFCADIESDVENVVPENPRSQDEPNTETERERLNERERET